ncbi:group 1 glycosyl transferase [Desulfovibrio sp. X2]|uniref:glycosyltransferase family 4 protein n=1 Tax=Desulfovibrio sp. X2 TaxID=941449 RepID=UPI00035895BA|nr:glycosyltransferase family 4 protein [Desulfovibrio sp. X2]EPR44083.1 group 1 glycosyl transferase [Desulfovibrio sp. X2]
MPRLLYLTQSGPTLPSVRFRVLPFVAAAQQAGIAAEYRVIPKGSLKRIPFFLGLPRADVLVLQKKLLNPFDLFLAARAGRRFVYDFDDAVWTSHPGVTDEARRRREHAKQVPRFAAACRRADQVVAGNEFLAERARVFNANVAVLPTPLDTDRYVSAPKGGGLPVIGWMGTACNQVFLPELFAALAPFSDRMRLSVISDEPYADESWRDVGFEKWSPEREIAQLQAMDIGLMPLSDDEYTRGKCGFKLLQYMACGAVPVASDVGFNREIVEHGRTGFLVRSPEEWREAVAVLLDDPARRTVMAAAAREAVVERFSLAAAARRLFSILGLMEA